MKVKSLSCVQLFVIPWTAAYQAPLPMGTSRQESWSGVPSFSWEGGGSSICYFYLNGLPTSHTNPIWTSTNFYLLQLSLFCEWIHHLTRCLSQKPVRVLFLFFFFDTSYFLTSTANSSPCPSDSTPFFQNMGTTSAQVSITPT